MTPYILIAPMIMKQFGINLLCTY